MDRRNFIAITSALAATSSLEASALGKVSSTLYGDQAVREASADPVPSSKPVFTLEEVKSLNAFQRARVRHPFTCRWNHRDANHLDGDGVLLATERGWSCLYCDYTQDWAPDWMKNWRWKEGARFLEAAEAPNKTAVSIAIAAAENCINVFEERYPGDDRPRQALQAAEQWLKEPTDENRRFAEAFEYQVWRASRKEWSDRAGSAADACGCATRALRHPYSSATEAIACERFANGRDWDYSSIWLMKLVRKLEFNRHPKP